MITLLCQSGWCVAYRSRVLGSCKQPPRPISCFAQLTPPPHLVAACVALQIFSLFISSLHSHMAPYTFHWECQHATTPAPSPLAPLHAHAAAATRTRAPHCPPSFPFTIRITTVGCSLRGRKLRACLEPPALHFPLEVSLPLAPLPLPLSQAHSRLYLLRAQLPATDAVDYLALAAARCGTHAPRARPRYLEACAAPFTA